MSPQRIGPFLVQKMRLDCKSPAHHDVYPFIAKKDMLVLVTGGTLYITVGGVEYAESIGAVRHFKPGDKVYFVSRKSYAKQFLGYAEFVMISEV